MEIDDVVLIKDIIPNCSLSKKIEEMLGTKVRVEDINRTEIKVKGIWIPKEFVKEVAFKHYTEEELARRSKIEEYGEYLAEKTAPLSLRLARFLENYIYIFIGILFVLFLASFAIGVVVEEYGKISKSFVVICFCSIGATLGSLIFYTILWAVIKKCKVEENFRAEVYAKTIKSLKVSVEEIERLKLHW
jgi:magnesium-transporting ATPase (P-type)